MLSLSNPHPVSLVLYKKRNFFSPKLYLKESVFRRKEEIYKRRLIGATAAVLVAAGMTILFNYSKVLI